MFYILKHPNILLSLYISTLVSIKKEIICVQTNILPAKWNPLVISRLSRPYPRQCNPKCSSIISLIWKTVLYNFTWICLNSTAIWIQLNIKQNRQKNLGCSDPLHGTLIVKQPSANTSVSSHDDVIKWRHFPRYWPFVRRIHRSPVNSPHKDQWRGVLMFSFICWINGWVNNRKAGDLGRYRAHYEVTVMTHHMDCLATSRLVICTPLCTSSGILSELIISLLLHLFSWMWWIRFWLNIPCFLWWRATVTRSVKLDNLSFVNDLICHWFESFVVNVSLLY